MIRRKAVMSDERVKRNRGDFFRYMQSTLRQGQEIASQAVSQAGTELKSAIQQARETLLEAEQAMSAGTKSFQEAAEKCDAASRQASGATLQSIAGSEAGMTSAMVTIVEGLQHVAEGIAQPPEIPAPTQTKPSEE